MTVAGNGEQLERAAILLSAIVFLKLLFHALFLPAWEGPDEPLHVARAVAFATLPWSKAFPGIDMQPEIVASVREHPCSPEVADFFHSPRFGGQTALFNVLRFERPREVRTDWIPPNYENHQPPLYYIVTGGVLRLPGGRSLQSPLLSLLILRLISVVFAVLAVVVMMRFHRTTGVAIAAMMLLPGGAEALARASNDAMLMLWAALTITTVWKNRPRALVVLLLALGPLIKLTAFPIVAVVITREFLKRNLLAAVTSAVAACTVFVVQALRGWAWGGTYELNRTSNEVSGSIAEVAIGVAKTIYVFLKTIFWLGGWSFFRAPSWLVGLWFAIVVVFFISIARIRREGLVAHVSGVAVATGGFILMALLNRNLFGSWGGLGGWYFWGWLPWLLVTAHEHFDVRGSFRKPLIVAAALFVVVANVLWFVHAAATYGA